MCDNCGASYPSCIINTHIHRHTLRPRPALAHRRYGNNSNSTFIPVSLLVNHVHLLAILRPPFECVMPLIYHVRCTSSMHTCTALNCMPVWHLHTTDVIRVTVSAHHFHYRSPMSICLPHCATIGMFEICGASWPMHVLIPHMHCSKLHPCPALAYHRYSNNSNSTFTPVSLSITHSHLFGTLRHFISNSETPSQTQTYANSRETVMVIKCGMQVLLHIRGML